MSGRTGKLIWLVNLGLIVLLGYVGSGLFLERGKGSSFGSGARSPGSGEASPAAVRTSSPEDRQFVANSNLFGTTKPRHRGPRPATPAPGSRAEARAKRLPPLQLRLLGTVAGDPKISLAVIEDLTRKFQDVYKVGDSVQGAEIVRILEDKVALRRDGMEHVLSLCVGTAAAGKAGPAAPSRPEKTVPSAEAVRVSSPSRFEINKRALLARIGGMEAILKKVKATEYKVNGKTEGLKLTGLNQVTMARFVGLREGDILQVVNGQELTSLPKAFQVFRKARKQSFVDLKILRRGEQVRLSYGIQ